MPRYQSIKNIPLEDRQISPSVYKEESGEDIIYKTLKERIQKFQAGGSVQADQEWLQNWYANRQIVNPQIQAAYNEDRESFNTLSQFIPEPIVRTDLPEYTKGQYDPETNEIYIAPNASPNTYLHEATHRTQNFNSAMRPIHRDLVTQNLFPQKSLSAPYSEDYEYYSDPDEVHARIQVLRREAGIQPTQTVTPEYLQNFFQNYQGQDGNIEDLQNLMDEQGLLNLLNNMAETPQSLQTYAKNGGVIEDDMGQLKYPGMVTKINSGDITMKGVFRPLVGIDNLGNIKLMMPGQDYKFPGESVTEYPI